MRRERALGPAPDACSSRPRGARSARWRSAPSPPSAGGRRRRRRRRRAAGRHATDQGGDHVECLRPADGKRRHRDSGSSPSRTRPRSPTRWSWSGPTSSTSTPIRRWSPRTPRSRSRPCSAPGTYSWRCTALNGTVTYSAAERVHGPKTTSASFVPVTFAQLQATTTVQYRAAVTAGLAQLATDTDALTQAVASGNLAAARALWLPAHLEYERLGAAYGTFGDYDQQINGLPVRPRGRRHEPEVRRLPPARVRTLARSAGGDAGAGGRGARRLGARSRAGLPAACRRRRPTSRCGPTRSSRTPSSSR